MAEMDNAENRHAEPRIIFEQFGPPSECDAGQITDEGTGRPLWWIAEPARRQESAQGGGGWSAADEAALLDAMLDAARDVATVTGHFESELLLVVDPDRAEAARYWLNGHTAP